ncbi:MAG: carboxymuconolactone decarboxylase family protein [Acidimicrobiales bacterium]|jgi:alkylhydroperoxidase family enzyme
MPNVTVPAGDDPLMYVWTTLARPLTAAAGGFTNAVYENSKLSIREFEAARFTIALVNDCAMCLDWRSARDVPARGASPDDVPESLYEAIGSGDDSELSERERLAAEFARRFATEHRGMDADLWARLHAEYTDDELVDLALCVGSWLAFGRFNQVFDIDGACRVPAAATTGSGHSLER